MKAKQEIFDKSRIFKDIPATSPRELFANGLGNKNMFKN